MRKVPVKELFILDKPEISDITKQELLDFNRRYQNRILRYFAELRIRFEAEFPGISFPGLFAEVDSISGETRPLSEQRAWSWGDCRGLGIWSYFIVKGVIPDELFSIHGKSLNLLSFYKKYCDMIYENLIKRYKKNDGQFPFLVDIRTNLASDDPRNVPAEEGHLEPGHVFASAGISQYGILKKDNEIFDMGLKLLEETFDCGINFANVDHITKKCSGLHSEGFLMVTLGAIVDILKCLNRSTYKVDPKIIKKLISKGHRILNYILEFHFDHKNGKLWEYNTLDGKPFINEKGHWICDPGHTAEFCGFASEFCDISGDKRIVPELIKILSFINENAYSPVGLMYKNIDLYSLCGITDKIGADGKEYKTAPWWNLRECTSAAMKLYQLSGDKKCLSIYKKAQNATYLNYPNQNIGGLMVQTLDAETLRPLPFHPATGNLDPMHCPRAREREIEALELL